MIRAILLITFFSLRVCALDFFENSSRDDMPATGDVASAITQVTYLGHTCTGFFVKNSQDRLLIASARHCADFLFTRVCHLGILKIKTHAGGFEGTCDHIVASDPEHDAVIFEAHFPDARVRSAISYLTLSAEVVPSGTPLEMYGHPNDRARRGSATVTKNCWVNNGVNDSTVLGVGLPTRAVTSVDVVTNFIRAHEKMIGYNCDVYGGNSGGPVVQAGTSTVVGMPATYYANQYVVLPKTNSAYFYSLDSFLMANSAALARAGVTWVRP